MREKERERESERERGWERERMERGVEREREWELLLFRQFNREEQEETKDDITAGNGSLSTIT